MSAAQKPDSLSRIERERDERVKELKCLYNLANELEQAREIEPLLEKISGFLSDAMQYPELCSAVITLNGREHSASPESRPIKSSITQDLLIQGEIRGSITIRCHGDEEFIQEEHDLLSSVSKILARAIERFDFQKTREEYTTSLELMVEERLSEVRKSRARYKSLYDNAPVGICVSTPSGEIISANRAFMKMFKYPSDLKEKPHLLRDNLYCSPEVREHIIQELEVNGIISDFELAMRARDGSTLTVSLSSIQYDDNGEVRYESILKDVTEKKKLEEKLKKQKDELKIQIKKRTNALVMQRDKVLEMNKIIMGTTTELESSISNMRTLFNAITDTVLSIDRNFTIVMTNQEEKDQGKKCYQVLFGSSQVCKKCPAQQAIKFKKPASIEVAEGDRIYLLQCYPVINAQGEVEGVIEWAKEITEEKNIHHQMLQADRLASLGQLVSGIGHEINNPNTFLLGNMKILREAMGDMTAIVDEYYKSHSSLKIARLDYPFFKEHLNVLMDDMVNGALRIKLIVEDMKKFARKSDEKLVDSVSLNQVVESSIRLAHNQVKRKASIVTELDEEIPLTRANPLGIEQILINMIINAADAIKDGEKGTIWISTSYDEEAEAIVLSVRDNGIGMDKATMKQVFNPFFTTKRGHGGTGLGLSISYRIVKEHDGEIEVESTPGSGTTFKIIIPVTEEKKEA